MVMPSTSRKPKPASSKTKAQLATRDFGHYTPLTVTNSETHQQSFSYENSPFSFQTSSLLTRPLVCCPSPCGTLPLRGRLGAPTHNGAPICRNHSNPSPCDHISQGPSTDPVPDIHHSGHSTHGNSQLHSCVEHGCPHNYLHYGVECSCTPW